MLMRCWTLSPLLLLLSGACGCGVQRTLQVESDPPGALVYLNGEEAGRTPMRKNFVWYGTYDVQLRKEGYHTLSRETKVWAPWWQWPPIDLFAEVLPLEDKHFAHYTLKPITAEEAQPRELLGRAVAMRRRLRSSEFTQQWSEKRKRELPATQPAESPGDIP